MMREHRLTLPTIYLYERSTVSERDSTARIPNYLLERVTLCRATVKDRLDNHVKRQNGCWEYQGTLDKSGYGRFTLCHKSLKPYKQKAYAHRAAFALHKGIDPGKKLVCHTCDNPKCVNPDHLFLGTYQDNMTDMAAKGRARRSDGENNPNSKLDWRAVLEIRDLCERGLKDGEIAARYGVTGGAINQIRLGKSWKACAIPHPTKTAA